MIVARDAGDERMLSITEAGEAWLSQHAGAEHEACVRPAERRGSADDATREPASRTGDFQASRPTRLLGSLGRRASSEEAALALAVLVNRAVTRLHNLARTKPTARKAQPDWPPGRNCRTRRAAWSCRPAPAATWPPASPAAASDDSSAAAVSVVSTARVREPSSSVREIGFDTRPAAKRASLNRPPTAAWISVARRARRCA